MNNITSICKPKGFYANGLNCRIKHSKKNDLSLIYSKVPAKAACVFTQNAIQAAHILVDKKHLKASKFTQAIVINSGNANCANGKSGVKDAQNICSSFFTQIFKQRIPGINRPH